MKNILQISILIVFIFLLLSCNKDKESGPYYTKFHTLYWDVDTVPLTLPSSALDQTFQIKDRYGKFCVIIGVPRVYAINQQDTVRIYNTGLNSNLKMSILSDTIRGTWFTIINEKEKGLRVILDKNEETEARYLNMPVWARPFENTNDGEPDCDALIINQLPSKKD